MKILLLYFAKVSEITNEDCYLELRRYLDSRGEVEQIIINVSLMGLSLQLLLALQLTIAMLMFT